MTFKSVKASELAVNPFTKIGKEWLLITGNRGEETNTMTASWGGLGVLWNRDVATVYIRPQRYTKEFIDASEYFTLSFFAEEYRKELNFLGKVSGRDTDKMKETGLTIIDAPHGTKSYQEASLVLVLKKMYRGKIDLENFIDPSIEKFYPEKDYHEVYIGEIVDALVKVDEE